jgi:hypothetical protein
MNCTSKCAGSLRHLFPVVLFFIFSVFCEGEQPRGFVPVMPDQKIRRFNYPFEAVWISLVQILEYQDIDIETLDKSLGTMITDFIPLDPKSKLGTEALFPEQGERLIEKAKYDMVIEVKKTDENETTVQIEVNLSKFSRALMSYYKWRDQLSSGVIEKYLFENLQGELAGKQ